MELGITFYSILHFENANMPPRARLRFSQRNPLHVSFMPTCKIQDKQLQ